MLSFINKQNLFTKLLVTFLLTAAISTISTGLLSYYQAKKSVEEAAVSKLLTIRDARKENIMAYLQRIESQIVILAEDPTVRNALIDFSQSFVVSIDTGGFYDPTEAKNDVKRFYDEEFIPAINANSLGSYRSLPFVPTDERAVYFQYHYISKNQKGLGEKDNLYSVDDSDHPYHTVHAQNHTFFKQYQQEFGYYDLFLVDMQGNIVYTVFKETDFATNLLTGPHRKSNLATVVKKSIGATQFKTVWQDYDFYVPSYNSPAAFVSTPVYRESKQIGVLAFQIPTNQINDLVSGSEGWVKDGLGNTGDIILMGQQDRKSRAEIRPFIEDKESLFYNLSVLRGKEVVEMVKTSNSSILTISFNSLVAEEVSKGRSGVMEDRSYLGQEILAAYTTLDFKGLHWGIISHINVEEAFKATDDLRNYLPLILFIILTATGIMVWYFAQTISKPLIEICSYTQDLAKGDFPSIRDSQDQNEIGSTFRSLKELTGRLKQAALFASQVGKGDFDSDLKVDNEQDILGVSLIKMRDNIKDSKIDEDKRRWANEGLRKFTELLRGDLESVARMGDIILPELAAYIEASVVLLYVAEEQEDDKYLELAASYAYKRKKHIHQRIELGEGAVGQCFFEQRTLLITEVPENYLTIRSGMGQSTPEALLVVPLMMEDKITGVLEIGFVHTPPQHYVSFVDRLSVNIGSELYAIGINRTTQQLLRQSQATTEQLRSQEEEMRQNMEELVATQEEMERVQVENERKSEQMQQLNEKMIENEKKLTKTFNRASKTEAVINNLPVLLLNLKADEKQTVLYTNDYARSLFGYETEELNERYFANVIYEKDRERVVDFKQELVVGQKYNIMYRIVTDEGNIIEVRDTGQLITDEKSSSVVCCLTLRTESEKKQS